MSIRVLVAGALGKMGQEVVRMVTADPELELVGGVEPQRGGRTLGDWAPDLGTQAPCFDSVREGILATNPDVMVDFTTPHVVFDNTRTCIELGVRPVVGTTGMSTEQVAELKSLCQEKKLGGLIAPNFAIGAVLMMKFAAQAAKYLPHVEIIELHHDQKLDAPSGTAIKTAEGISEVRQSTRQGHPEEEETIAGARGGLWDGFRIHSVRLPGLVAHQEVLFGAEGQLLTIRHDSFNRTSFMPGVKLAIKSVMHLQELVYGLDAILD